MSALPRGQSRPVLILGASARISIPIARSLQKCGVAVDVAHLSKTDPKFRSRAVRECILLPDFREHPAEMLDSLTSLIRSRGYDTLIPVQDGAAQIVAENYSVLSSLLRVASPPPHVLRRVLDKDATLRVARQCGIPIPRSYTVATPAELGAVASELTFPVVMKPSVHNGQPSFKVRYFEHIDHLKMALTENRCGPVLLQEYCAGEGVGVEMLIHQGACLATFQHRRLKEGPASGGVAVMAISEEPDPVLAEDSLKLLRALEWEGVAMVEFRRNPANGRYALMEVNGRYWGTSSLPILAGLDFPAYQWRLLHDADPRIPSSYKAGLRWRWTAGYISRLHDILLRSGKGPGRRPSRIDELLRLPLDFAPSIQDALWSFHDPLPSIVELWQTLRQWAAADLRGAVRKILPKRSFSRRIQDAG